MGCGIVSLKLFIIVSNQAFFLLGCFMIGWGAYVLKTGEEGLLTNQEYTYNCIHGVQCEEGMILTNFKNLTSNKVPSSDTPGGFQAVKSKVKTEFYAILAMSMIAGAILCFFSIIACCGAVSDKRKLLKAYTIALSIVILLEIVAASVAFAAIKDMESMSNYTGGLKTGFLTWFPLYGIVLSVLIFIELFIALTACFLSTKIKHEVFQWTNLIWKT